MNHVQTYELTPNDISQKSYYGKANVTIISNEKTGEREIKLTSYTTNVANIYEGIGSTIVEVYGTYSPTTLKHIKSFLRSYGLKAESKSQIEEDYS